MNYFALTELGLKRLLTRRSLIASLLGIMFGALAVWGWERPAVDYRMETLCAQPKNEGEVTLFVVLNGKTHCWRFN